MFTAKDFAPRANDLRSLHRRPSFSDSESASDIC